MKQLGWPLDWLPHARARRSQLRLRSQWRPRRALPSRPRRRHLPNHPKSAVDAPSVPVPQLPCHAKHLAEGTDRPSRRRYFRLRATMCSDPASGQGSHDASPSAVGVCWRSNHPRTVSAPRRVEGLRGTTRSGSPRSSSERTPLSSDARAYCHFVRSRRRVVVVHAPKTAVRVGGDAEPCGAGARARSRRKRS
jgi:hypothetical protein